MMKDFSGWEEYEGLSEGSGRSEKVWLKNPKNNEIGLFKYTKSDTTTEHISEKIAELLAERIDIKCAHIDIGTYHGRKGSMSYQINKHGENLIEGINLITRYYLFMIRMNFSIWNTIINTLTNEKIKEIIDNYAGNEISLKRAELIYKIICKKIHLLEEIFGRKEE